MVITRPLTAQLHRGCNNPEKSQSHEHLVQSVVERKFFSAETMSVISLKDSIPENPIKVDVQTVIRTNAHIHTYTYTYTHTHTPHKHTHKDVPNHITAERHKVARIKSRVLFRWHRSQQNHVLEACRHAQLRSKVKKKRKITIYIYITIFNFF